MYKNHIFDPLNLSSLGEKNILIQEEKLSISIHKFKSNVFPIFYTIIITSNKYNFLFNL